jgi:hypothetical protein
MHTVPLTSSDPTPTILSHLYAEHTNGRYGLFCFFDRNTARNFSLVNKECANEIKNYRNSPYVKNPWPNMIQYVYGSLRLANGRQICVDHDYLYFHTKINKITNLSMYYIGIEYDNDDYHSEVILVDHLEWKIIKDSYDIVNNKEDEEQYEYEKKLDEEYYKITKLYCFTSN